VSHSLVTAKIDEEKLWSKLEHARGPNVPPLCDIIMTIGLFFISIDL
jgi:hypothetical protein